MSRALVVIHDLDGAYLQALEREGLEPLLALRFGAFDDDNGPRLMSLSGPPTDAELERLTDQQRLTMALALRRSADRLAPLEPPDPA